MDCPICLGPLNRSPDGIEDTIRRRLTNIRTATCCCTPCGHIFHKACLLRWLDKTNRPPCPVCNVKLSKMKLYPAYLNVDKGGTSVPFLARSRDEIFSGVTVGGGSGSGAGASPSLSSSFEPSTSSAALNLADAIKQNRPGGSINATATIGHNCGGFCSMSHNAPGLTAMTLGTYALTSLGPVPMVTATTIGMIPPAHSSGQSAGARMERDGTGSAFEASLSGPPAPRTSTYTSWGTGSEPTITNTISRDPEYPYGGGTSITTTILGNGLRPSVIKRSYGGSGCVAPAHYNREGDNARERARYHPYLQQQPPPAHSMSSSSSYSRRSNDQIYNMFYNNVFGIRAGGERAGNEGRVLAPASRTSGRAHASDEFDGGSPTQPEEN